MDEKFKLIFVEPGQSPTEAVFLSGLGHSYPRLRDAVEGAQNAHNPWDMPYIWHKHIMLGPQTIAMLWKEFTTAG